MGGHIELGKQQGQENRHGLPSLDHLCLAKVKKHAAHVRYFMTSSVRKSAQSWDSIGSSPRNQTESRRKALTSGSLA